MRTSRSWNFFVCLLCPQNNRHGVLDRQQKNGTIKMCDIYIRVFSECIRSWSTGTRTWMNGVVCNQRQKEPNQQETSKARIRITKVAETVLTNTVAAGYWKGSRQR